MTNHEFSQRFLDALAAINSSLDLSITQDAVVKQTAQLFGAKGASLMLFSPGDESLQISANYGLSQTYLTKGSISPRQSLGETLHKAPVVIRDISQDPNVQYRQAAQDEGIKCIVGLPLEAGKILVGSLRLYFSDIKDFTLEEMEYLKALSRQVGLALKKAFYFASMKASVSELHRMPELGSSREAMLTICRTAAQYGHAKGCALLLVNMETGSLQNIISFGLSERYLTKGPLSAMKSLGEVSDGKPVIISSVANDPRVQYKDEAAHENIKAIIGLPVWVGNVVAGSLRLYYQFEFVPDADDLIWMDHLSHHAGMALEKNQLLIKLKDRHDWYKDILADMDTQPFRG
jgi:GAF domain-containing protein